MDIVRPELKRKKRIRRIIYIAIIVILIPLVTYGLSKLKPAPPTVDGSTLYPGVVKRGDMVIERRGLGTLVPEDVQVIAAITQGRVVRRLLPGVPVKADTVIMVLTDPQLEQQAQSAAYKVKADEAGLDSLKASLQNQLMQYRTTAANVQSQYSQAAMNADSVEQLYKSGIDAEITYKQAIVQRDGLKTQNEMAQKQVETFESSISEQLAVQQAVLDQDKAQADLLQRQVDQEQVRARIDGILQEVPPEIGTEVTPGSELAKVAQQTKLKAALQIAETQAKDIQLGQKASVDTHNGIITGHVERIDPSVTNGTRTVDVHLDGPLPSGAVPQLSVEGTILIEKLTDVLYVGRPVHGDQDSTIGLFKVTPDGREAARVNVEIGRASVSNVEVKRGLNVGDVVILSDMSADDAFERIRLSPAIALTGSN
ncbi:MAG TPA: HlyD family efflux transporter periplasmic adaptor subunit [Candidatus Acidoferrales bacterium]|nr:HlyD family efflux transporter periplasmic adaptor subunit [Candidatus Acidoferrales bacterium]